MKDPNEPEGLAPSDQELAPRNLSSPTIPNHQKAPLSDSDKERWENHLIMIRAGARVFFRVGEALKEIRDKRLYREQYSDFDDFCRDVYGQSKSHANRQISASEVFYELERSAPIGAEEQAATFEILPKSESQAHPLTRLKRKAERRQAWAEAIKKAKGRAITAEIVAEAVGEIDPALKKSKKELTASPTEPPPKEEPDEFLENLLERLRNAIGDESWTQVEEIAEELQDWLEDRQ